tara:strand:+ start:1156 stop:1419 length:264 start_codon:yes stop_codon:yes gene_type:complete
MSSYAIVLDDGETWSSDGWIVVYKPGFYFNSCGDEVFCEDPMDYKHDFDGANNVPEQLVEERIPIEALMSAWWNSRLAASVRKKGVK